MAKQVTTYKDGAFVARLPSDLGRVAGKGLRAEEAFLDLMDELEVDENQFRRSYSFAKIGSRAVSRAISYMQAMNNAEAIRLQRQRVEAHVQESG